MTDKTIFNGGEDDPTTAGDANKFDKGGLLPSGLTVVSHDQFLDGDWNPPEEEKKQGIFGRFLGAVALLAVTGVFVAACIWLIAAMMANLPTR